MPQGEVKRDLQAEQDQRLYIRTIFIKVLDVKKAYQLNTAARKIKTIVLRMGMHHDTDRG